MRTSATAAALLIERYPTLADRTHVIRNGYDGEIAPALTRTGGRLSILFAGVLYVRRTPFPLLAALERLLRDFPGPDFILAAGDDRTDEDLFERAPADAWTVHIGPGATRAAFVVADLQILRSVLESLATAGTAVLRPARTADRC